MQHLEVSGAVRHTHTHTHIYIYIYIYVIRRLKVNATESRKPTIRLRLFHSAANVHIRFCAHVLKTFLRTGTAMTSPFFKINA